MALTATKDLPLGTTVTGSWPRPEWYTRSLWGGPLDEALLDPVYREQFGDALAVVVAEQERAGLDLVTNGDYHLDADFGGRSWSHYPLQRWLGLEHAAPPSGGVGLPELPPGGLITELLTSWRWPAVTGRVEHNPRNPLHLAKIFRMTQARTRRPVKFGTVSASVLGEFLFPQTDVYPPDDNKRRLIWDMATALNRELRELVAAGCQVIQIEEPTIHAHVAQHPEDTETLDFLVDVVNHELSGLEDAEVWVHTCFGNPMSQRVWDMSYERSFEAYMERVNLDVWTVEMRDRGQRDLERFGAWKGKTKRKVAIGAVSHRTLQADTPEEVAQQIRNALEYVDLENLLVSSDCGFGRQGINRTIALYKASALAQGANIVRREHGLPETYVPLADPQLAQDVVP